MFGVLWRLLYGNKDETDSSQIATHLIVTDNHNYPSEICNGRMQAINSSFFFGKWQKILRIKCCKLVYFYKYLLCTLNYRIRLFGIEFHENPNSQQIFSVNSSTFSLRVHPRRKRLSNPKASMFMENVRTEIISLTTYSIQSASDDKNLWCNKEGLGSAPHRMWKLSLQLSFWPLVLKSFFKVFKLSWKAFRVVSIITGGFINKISLWRSMNLVRMPRLTIC